MKIFLSYQQTWIDNETLLKDLQFFRRVFIEKNIENYIYYLDEKEWNDVSYVCEKAKEEIEKSDLVIAYINHQKRSEWMLLELGIAYSLWKEIKIFINKKYKDDYLLIYWLTKKENIIFFDEMLEIEEQIKRLV